MMHFKRALTILAAMALVSSAGVALAAIVVIVGAGAAGIMKNGSFSSSLTRRLPVRPKGNG